MSAAPRKIRENIGAENRARVLIRLELNRSGITCYFYLFSSVLWIGTNVPLILDQSSRWRKGLLICKGFNFLRTRILCSCFFSYKLKQSFFSFYSIDQLRPTQKNPQDILDCGRLQYGFHITSLSCKH